MSSGLRVAVDANGGDFAPKSVVEGVLRSRVDNPGIKIILVGDEKAEQVFAQLGGLTPGITFKRAAQVIGMAEHPTDALRAKPQASLLICNRLVRDGEADAAFSAGNTGAMMAAATLTIGRVKGASRPALPTPIPNLKDGSTVLLDAGANSDCKPFQLLQFAAMGTVYAKILLGVDNPKVGLLNIGIESSKGNELTLETHGLFTRKLPNFAGNVEGNAVFKGEVDVVVCDGFVGNVFLKTAEGTASFLLTSFRQKVKKNLLAKLGVVLMLPALKSLRRRADPQEYGGSPLLGLRGVSIVGHGASTAAAVCNAIRLAGEFKTKQLCEKLELALKGQEKE